MHGDTYPLLAYAAYIPGGRSSPGQDGFDQLDGALWVATGYALLAAAAMHRTGAAAGRAAGLRLTIAGFASSRADRRLVGLERPRRGGLCRVAVALAAHTRRSTAALTLAGAVKLAPCGGGAAVALGREQRGRGSCVASGWRPSVVAGVVVWVIALGGVDGLGDMAHALSFQVERGSLLSLWTLTGASAAQVAVQAAVVTLLVAGAARMWADRALALDLPRVAALSAAVLLGIQIAANYWTYAYLPWVFPLVAVALLAPGRRGVDAPA